MGIRVCKIPLFFQLGIIYAGVIDRLQLLNQHGLGIGNIAEGNGAFSEVAFCHLGIDKFVYEVADALFRVVRKGA